MNSILNTHDIQTKINNEKDTPLNKAENKTNSIQAVIELSDVVMNLNVLDKLFYNSFARFTVSHQKTNYRRKFKFLEAPNY